MILSKIKELYTSYRKTFFYTLVFGFLFYIGQEVAFGSPLAGGLDDAIAANSTGASKATGTGADTNAIIEVVDWLITIASSLIAILSAFVALFLHPGWVNGTVLGFDVFLKDIWIMISNIVYFIFAFVLITIAFMNIIGKGQDIWEMKQALPKFVIGVLIVPFSWFFVQFVLSLSAMLTVAVLSLPYETLNGKDAFRNAKDTKICTDYIINLTKSEDSIGLKKDGECAFGEDKKSVSEVLRGDGDGISSSVFGMINVYTYSIMKIDSLDDLSADKIVESIKTLTDTGLKIVFDLLFIIVYLILMVALFMALFARATWLWIHAMFSPVFGLLFFFGKGKEGALEGKFGPLELIKLALVPVYVSAALAFGMIFIFVAAHGLSEKTDKTNGIIQEIDHKGEKIPALSVGSFTIGIKGTHGGESGVTKTDVNSLFNSLGNGLGQIILELFGLAILWLAMMAALKGSKITESVTEPIRAFGKSVGSLIAKSPQYAPIIPTGKGGMMNAASLKNFGETTVGSINSKMAKPGGELSNKFFGDGTKMHQALRDLKLSKVNVDTEDGGRINSKLIPVLDLLNNKELLKSDYKEAVDHLRDSRFINEDGAKKLEGLFDHRGDKNFAKKLYDAIKDNGTGKTPLAAAGIRSEADMKVKIGDTTGPSEKAPGTDGNKASPSGVQNAVFSGSIAGNTSDYKVNVSNTNVSFDSADDGKDIKLKGVLDDKGELVDKDTLHKAFKKEGLLEREYDQIEKQIKEVIKKKKSD